MAKGQAEHLIPMIGRFMAPNDWCDLDMIAVGVGPGNFTGIRISVAAARGLGLALGIPVMGVSNFDILATNTGGGFVLLSLPAPRDQAYVQFCHQGKPDGPPRLIDPANPPADLQQASDMQVHGFRAMQIAGFLGVPGYDESRDTGLGMEHMAELAEKLLLQTPKEARHLIPRPAPLYVKPADAAPSRIAPPVMLS